MESNVIIQWLLLMVLGDFPDPVPVLAPDTCLCIWGFFTSLSRSALALDDFTPSLQCLHGGGAVRRGHVTEIPVT